jgi:hypothetical protein
MKTAQFTTVNSLRLRSKTWTWYYQKLTTCTVEKFPKQTEILKERLANCSAQERMALLCAILNHGEAGLELL